MRLTLVAVGRARRGPEADLVADYLDRATRAGRPLGLSGAELVDVDDRKAGSPGEEARLLRRALPAGAKVVCLDQRGRNETSDTLAAWLAEWRDTGTRDAAFVIGGADGLDPALVAEADVVLSFGRMVWPHLLARVMMAEQIYRATSILAGSPYHRA